MIKCIFENGGEAHLRHVTVDAIIFKDQKILLVKRSPSSHIEPGKYALPGGYLERNEAADQGITREVLEETGYTTTINKLFMIIHAPRLKGDDRQNVGFFYTLNLSKKIQSPDHEIDSIDWFPLDHLPLKDQIAFDHFDVINLFHEYLNNPQKLPYINFKSTSL